VRGIAIIMRNVLSASVYLQPSGVPPLLNLFSVFIQSPGN